MAYLVGPGSPTSSSTISSQKQNDGDEPQSTCHQCQSINFITDWASGDVVCTECGVVNEEHIRDSGAEWREFNDDNDRAKGLPSVARCGLIPNDESKYVGGLEPTVVSRRPYGGGYGHAAIPCSMYGYSAIAKGLDKTSRKVDKIIDRLHRDEIKEADLARQVHAKMKQEKLERRLGAAASNGSASVEEEGAELDGHDEAEVEHRKLLSNTERWSLDRALLLYGNDETETSIFNEPTQMQRQLDQQREELMQRISKSDKAAARDVYQAYKILEHSSLKLSLPNKVLMESAHTMCQYAAKRNGFHVKGVSSRVSKNERKKDGALGSPSGTGKSGVDSIKDKRSDARELNKLKQMGALGAALHYIFAKRLGYDRSLANVCTSFNRGDDNANAAGKSRAADEAPMDKVVRTKSCSKAIAELRNDFPHLFFKSSSKPSVGNSAVDAAKLVEHSTRLLHLPPQAIATIKALASQCSQEQLESGFAAGSKPSTVCAAITYLVCLAGSTMQRLAKQATTSEDKMIKTEPRSSQQGKIQSFEERKRKISSSPYAGSTSESPTKKLALDGGAAVPFDVMNSAAVWDEKTKKAEENLQGWRAWLEQKSWGSDLKRIEHSSGVSRTVILDFYKKNLHGRRASLLEAAHMSLKSGDRDGLGLVSIASAAPLMVPEKR